MPRKTIVLLAPGAGLGHLVRVSAIACALSEKGAEPLILTTSKWGRSLSAVTKIPTIGFRPDLWSKEIGTFLSDSDARVVVQDTFPFGFREENLESIAEKKRFVYLARYLKTDAYLEKYNRKWETNSPLLYRVIRIEPLEDRQQELLEKTPVNYFRLSSRIRFPVNKIRPAIPEALKRLMASKKIHLIVHSGPEHETEKLIAVADNMIQDHREEKIVTINPFLAEKKKENAFDIFPAAVLFQDAFKIYTGGGYNSIAETEDYPEKTTYIAFPRYYDNQQARIDKALSQKKMPAAETAAEEAADIILSIL